MEPCLHRIGLWVCLWRIVSTNLINVGGPSPFPRLHKSGEIEPASQYECSYFCLPLAVDVLRLVEVLPGLPHNGEE